MQVEWRPDPDNVYLTSGNDNLALHSAGADLSDTGQALDHIGFILKTPEDVDAWYARLSERGAKLRGPPHRLEAFGIYCFFAEDPNGYVVEFQQFVT